MIRAFLLSLLLVALMGCVVAPESDGLDAPIIANAEGSALLLEATRAAQRAINERRTATIQSATLSAGGTRDAVEHSTTGTAIAIEVRQQEMNLNATANAAAFQQSGTREAATATIEAERIRATGTAQAIQIAVSETAIRRARENAVTETAAANSVLETATAARSTRTAEALLIAMERNRATATAKAMEMQQVQAQADAARWQGWAEFFDALLKVVVGIGLVAAVVMLIVQVARYLDALSMRQRLVETRAGTVLIMATRQGYSAELIRHAPNLLDVGEDEFGMSELPMVSQQAEELVKVTSVQGSTFLAKSDPEDEQRERSRKLAMRLLRESIRHYGAQGMNGGEAKRIPGHRHLEWSGETWNRAVAILRPYLIMKEGRGGGTFCGPQYPSLLQLYSAIGERRISFEVRAPHFPTPDERTSTA